MPLLRRLLSVFPAVIRDWQGCIRQSADSQSAFRLGLDFALSRFLTRSPRTRPARIRQVRFKNGVALAYRLNKGDLHSIREVWFEEDYRLPFEDPSGTLLDLGANIGMTSVWLAKRYSFDRVIAVEPDPANASLARRNLELNGIKGEVVQAAIGPFEGTARFETSGSSNLGRVSDRGLPVAMTTVAAILARSGCSRFGLVKIDIEGGEQALFEGPTDWLDSAGAIIAEFHPALVDCSKIVEAITSRGFSYIPSNSVFPDNMESFTSNARS
jgi:FkbM family methyltransferase